MALTVNERDNCRASQRFSKPNQGLSKQRALPLMLKKLSHPHQEEDSDIILLLILTPK